MVFFQLLRDGGFVMYPLLICSIITWAIIIEKIWALRKFSQIGDSSFKQTKGFLREKNIKDAVKVYDGVQESISLPIVQLIENRSKINGKEDLEDRLSRAMTDTVQYLKRYMWALATIASASPFIGLFGTVVGIINSFDSMAKTGKGGFSIVAAGLSEALIATASGILVAIVALVFYNYFATRIGRLSVQYRNRLYDIYDSLRE